MIKSKNTYILNFFNRMESKYGFSWDVIMDSSEFSDAERTYGKRLVKIALYAIRRGLETGYFNNASLDDFHIVKIFAGPEHTNEILRLAGYEAFWDQGDRSFRTLVMKTLENKTSGCDPVLLDEFKNKLNLIEYVDDFDNWDSDHETRRLSSYDLKRLDQHQFETVVSGQMASHI